MPTVPDIHRRGTRAAQGAATALTIGTLWFVTDEGVTERWAGSSWESWSGLAAHAADHAAGGSDPLKLDDLAAPDDTTDLNASAAGHGLLPKLSGVATEFLSGTGVFAALPASAPAAHAASHAAAGADPVAVTGLGGFPGGTATFLRGDATFATPAAAAPAAHAASHHTGGSDPLTTLDAAVLTTGTVPAARLPPRVGSVGLVIDGGASAITTGVKGFLEVPFAAVITAVTLLSADAAVTAGSIVIDIWKAPYASYPPTVANTITASAKPTLSSATKSRDTTLTGWTTAVAAGDILGFKVDSVATLTRVTLALTLQAS
jgi:hypothetical protein